MVICVLKEKQKMKKIYKSPKMIVITIQQAYHLMEASIGQGNAYRSGDAVLSRGGSYWDDDDDEDY